MKIIIAFLNLIYGFLSFWIIIAVIAFWNGMYNYPPIDYDRSMHYILLTGVLVCFILMNAIVLVISYLKNKKPSTVKHLIITAVLFCAIGMFISFVLIVLSTLFN